MWRYTDNPWNPAVDMEYRPAQAAMRTFRLTPARSGQLVAKCYLEPQDRCASARLRPNSRPAANPLTAQCWHIS